MVRFFVDRIHRLNRVGPVWSSEYRVWRPAPMLFLHASYSVLDTDPQYFPYSNTVWNNAKTFSGGTSAWML